MKACCWAPPIGLGYGEMIMKQETWELVELVMAGCPDAALRAFRKSVIGRGRPLTAREADSAIRGAQAALAGAQHETAMQWYHRALWYLKHKMPLIIATDGDGADQLTKIYAGGPPDRFVLHRRAALLARNDIVYLVFDDDGVSRTSGGTK